MNRLLKQALAIHHETAYRVANQVGRSPGWLSMVTVGALEPNEIEKKKLAKILGRSVTELFGQMETA